MKKINKKKEEKKKIENKKKLISCLLFKKEFKKWYLKINQ